MIVEEKVVLVTMVSGERHTYRVQVKADAHWLEREVERIKTQAWLLDGSRRWLRTDAIESVEGA